jgi:hypothetical protein
VATIDALQTLGHESIVAVEIAERPRMKTIYTDKLGLYPWALLFLSFVMFWSAYDTFLGRSSAPFGLDDNVGGLFLALGGSFWLFLAMKRFLDVRKAKREGRDPTIIGVRESKR